jgi:hypothetical protein
VGVGSAWWRAACVALFSTRTLPQPAITTICTDAQCLDERKTGSRVSVRLRSVFVTLPNRLPQSFPSPSQVLPKFFPSPWNRFATVRLQRITGTTTRSHRLLLALTRSHFPSVRMYRCCWWSSRHLGIHPTGHTCGPAAEQTGLAHTLGEAPVLSSPDPEVYDVELFGWATPASLSARAARAK